MTEKATMNLRQKLVQVYHDIDAVEKGAKNNAQGYSYVRAVDLVNAVRRSLKKLNIYAEIRFESLRAYSYTTAKGSTMNAGDVLCHITFYDADAILLNGVDAAPVHTASGLGSAADSGDKYLYKAQTGALKYALRNAFLIPDENDPEADERVDENTRYDDPEPAPRPRRQISEAPAEDRGSRPDDDYIRTERTVVSYEQAPSQPEPASIPATPAAAPKRQRVATPPIDMPTGGDIPNEEQLNGYRSKIVKLQNDLSAAGLKASPNKPINRKVLMYLLKTAGTDDATKISTLQWDAFFAFVDKMLGLENGIFQLAKLVNEAAK